MKPNIAVIGGGTIGAATALALANHQAKVTVFDRFSPPHENGAHAGESRLLRSIPYLESTPGEVELMVPALEGWERIERRTGSELITPCGGLVIDEDSSMQLQRTIEAGGEPLTESQLRSRFPQFSLRKNELAVFDARGGVIDPAAAVRAMLNLAVRSGAELRFNDPVTAVTPNEAGVIVATANRRQVFDKVVVAAGSSSMELEDIETRSRRLLLGWFTPKPGSHHLLRGCPSFVWTPGIGEFVYGAPSYDGATVKIGIDHEWGNTKDNRTLERNVTAADVLPMMETVERLFPWLDAAGSRFEMHIDSWTPDAKGIFGERADRPGVILATGWSGYGFKLAPALGESIARMALGLAPLVDLDSLSPSRFSDIQ